MDIKIQPGILSGSVLVPPSKSMAHRYLICAAFADSATTLICPQTNADISATVDCLNQLGAEIRQTPTGFEITPVSCPPKMANLNCRESGSTLRFLLPIVGALGIRTTLYMSGRLPERPLQPLIREMERMGCHIFQETDRSITCAGILKPGHYRIDGSVSSQFVSGLLLALPLIGGDSTLEITGEPTSQNYIAMTKAVMEEFAGGATPGTATVEGDWSSAAFWLAANALGNHIQLEGLNEHSLQGDKAISALLDQLKEHCVISAKDIPDLIPILSVVAAARKGAVFTDVGRLREKESDRVYAIVDLLTCLGGKAEATEDTLTIYGTGLTGGTVSSSWDHRIAMAAAIAATVCEKSVLLTYAECVSKSYPSFWVEFQRLGGKLCKVNTETT